MQGQKTLSFSYNMHLFFPNFLNDSQTISLTIHFSKPLLCVTLICADWSHLNCIIPVMRDKAAFVSAVLLCVQGYWETTIYPKMIEVLPLQKQHLVEKNELAFSFRPMQKDHQMGGKYANDIKMKRFRIHLKNDSFQ